MQPSRLQAPGLAMAFTDDEIEVIRRTGVLGAIDIELTLSCNLLCRYCYANAARPATNELTLREIIGIVDSAAELGARVVNLTGGEPLKSAHFFEVAEHAHSKGLHVMCFTNGTQITQQVARQMYDLEISPCVKLDALTPSIQDSLSARKGTYAKIMRGLSNLMAEGYASKLQSLSVNAVACKLNYEDIPRVWRWAREHKIVPSVARAHPYGRGSSNRDLLLRAEEIKALFKALSTIDKEFGEEWNTDIPWANGNACRRYYVGAFITSTGYVQPCSELPTRIGNVRLQKLADILSESPVAAICRHVERHLKGACGTCRQMQRCYGCRALAYSFTGDFLDADPLCWNNPSAL